MSSRLSQPRVVLSWAALLLAVASLCAGSKDKPTNPAASLRAGVREVVADQARVSKMLAAIDEIEATVGEMDTLIANERASLGALLRDYDSPRAAVDASLAEFNVRRESLSRRALTAHAEFKAQATASEWKKLRKLEMDMITFAASRSLGQAPSSGKES